MNIDISSILTATADTTPDGGELWKKKASAVLQRIKTYEDPDKSAMGHVDEVARECSGVLRQTKHLEPALMLTWALVRLRGLAGLGDGLSVIAELLERHWDRLYPPLHLDDPDPAWERELLLKSLWPPPGAGGDLEFRSTVLNADILGGRPAKLSIRELANPALQKESIDLSAITAKVVGRAQPSLLQEAVNGTTKAVQQLQAIVDIAAAHSLILDFQEYLSILGNVGAVLKKAMPVNQSIGDPRPGNNSPPVHGRLPEGDLSSHPTGPLLDRKQVMAALDQVCAYFERYEPDSAVGLMARRTRALLDKKGCMEVMRNLSPDAARLMESMLLGPPENS